MGNEQSIQPQLSSMKRPIPGQSLTNSPESPSAFEKPPKFNTVKKASEEIFSKLIDEEVYVPIMKLIDGGEATIMEVTQNLLYAGFRAGQWNPDMMLLLVEPTAYMLMALAERADIEYEIDNDVDVEGEQEAAIPEKLKNFSKALETKTPSKLNETAIPKSIRDRLDEAPTSLLARAETAIEEEDQPPIGIEEGQPPIGIEAEPTSLIEKPNARE